MYITIAINCKKVQNIKKLPISPTLCYCKASVRCISWAFSSIWKRDLIII